MREISAPYGFFFGNVSTIGFTIFGTVSGLLVVPVPGVLVPETAARKLSGT